MIATPTAATATEIEEMEHLVARYGTPSATPWHSVATPDRVTALAAQRTHTLLVRPITNKVCWRNDFELTGLACWTPLEWDSEQFGFPAARLDLLVANGDRKTATTIKRNLVSETVRRCGNRGIRHLTARVDAANLSSIDALQKNGFDLIDGIQTFSLQVPLAARFEKREHSFDLRLFRESDLPQVRSAGAGRPYVHRPLSCRFGHRYRDCRPH